jgi:hypothetical protein
VVSDSHLRSLDDAIRILVTARKALAPGSLTLWRMLDHAGAHLESQIAALLKEDAQASGCNGTLDRRQA